jgi:hypothetical protein
VSSPVLVGRQREREHLRRVLERAAGAEMLLDQNELNIMTVPAGQRLIKIG